MQQTTNKFLSDQPTTGTWSDSDVQSVHAQDEYEVVSDVLEQCGYLSNKLDWNSYD